MQVDMAQVFEAMVAGLRGSGLKDSAIAQAADVSKATICRYARGDGKHGSAECFVKLSGLYEQRLGAPPTIRTRR